MIPASKGWSLDALFFGKKTTLTLEKQPLKLSGCHGTLSMKSMVQLNFLKYCHENFCQIILQRPYVGR